MMTSSTFTSNTDKNITILELLLTREEDSGMVYISSPDIDDMFIAVKSEDEIRPAIDGCLKNAYADEAERVQVYTNGRLDGPTIGTMVKLTK